MLILVWKDSPPTLQQNTRAPLPYQSDASDFQSPPNMKRLHILYAVIITLEYFGCHKQLFAFHLSQLIVISKYTGQHANAPHLSVWQTDKPGHS